MVKTRCTRQSCWNKHVRAVAAEYPGLSLAQISKAASKTFKNRQAKKRKRASTVKGGCYRGKKGKRRR